MAERRSKSNKKFMLLSAIGIFMVVDSHTFTAFALFGSFLPYNSFFMPMFMFISGYFNRVGSDTGLLKYIWKKIRTLLIPYTLISLIVFGIQFLMDWYKLGVVPPYPDGYLKYMLDRVITVGSPYALVTPMWFVITLFATLLIYAVIKKFLGRIWNSYAALTVFLGLQILAVYLAKNTDPEALTYYLLPLKVLFFLPFLELGIIYRDHLEKKHSSMPAGGKVGLMVFLILINMVRTIYLPNPYDVAFDSLDDLSGFTSPYLITPFISSLIGIFFWLTLVDLIARPVGESRFINYMSCNTFWIMGMHIAFFNIFNCILMAVSLNIVKLKFFDVDFFRGSEWYFWEINLNIKAAYVLIGILGPLGFKYLCDRIYGPAVRVIDTRLKKKA